MLTQRRTRHVQLLRWTRDAARAIGTLLLAFLFLMLVGETIQDGLPSDLRLGDWLILGSWWVIMLGLALAWRWEGVGALLIFGGVAIHWGVSLPRGALLPQTFLYPFIAIGLLYLLVWWGERRAGGVEGDHAS